MAARGPQTHSTVVANEMSHLLPAKVRDRLGDPSLPPPLRGGTRQSLFSVASEALISFLGTGPFIL